MKRKILLTLVMVLLVVGLGLTAVAVAQDDPATSANTCPDFGRLDYNYACQNGNWRPVRPCPDFGRLDYNYACRYGGWWPQGYGSEGGGLD